MRFSLSVIALLLCCAAAPAQQTPAKPAAPVSVTAKSAKPDLWSNLPQEALKFSKQILPSGVPQSPAMTAPIECSPRGSAFLQIPMPPTFMPASDTFVAINKDGGATVFPKVSRLQGYVDVAPIAYFPGDGAVYALVQARKQLPPEEPGEAPSKGPLLFLIVRYSEDGSIEATHTLDTFNNSFLPEKFAPIPSGGFIVMGVQPLNNVLETFLLDSDGLNPREIDLSGSGLYSSGKLSKFFGEKNRSLAHGGPGLNSLALGAIQFVPYGDDVLLVQTGTNYPVAVIGNGGILRTVPLKLPPGTTIESFIPSSERNWYVALPGKLNHVSAHTIIEFDSVTGEPLRRFTTTSLPPHSIACDADGTWMAFKRVPEKGEQYGALALLTASQ